MENFDLISRRQILRVSAIAPALLTHVPRLFAAEFDLVIRGGRVLDPAQRIDRVADVAIRAGKIVAIRPSIAASSAAEVIEAGGKLVTPGLIDIHCHVASSSVNLSRRLVPEEPVRPRNEILPVRKIGVPNVVLAPGELTIEQAKSMQETSKQVAEKLAKPSKEAAEKVMASFKAA